MNPKLKCLISILLCLVLTFGILSGTGIAAQYENDTNDTFAIDTIHHGFRVYQVESIDYMGINLYFLEHEKTGAYLIYAASDDQERAFGVSFRTVGQNDKGLPHVFEHSALSGSLKYPDSNLIFSMINQTYNTFINAETHQFATLYPVSSLSEEQLFVDMDVYMSGVLHPVLLTDERAMMREAWHYNLDDPDDDITISGVVYSEMSANYGVMQYVADIELKKMLFPGSFSSSSIGGDPSVIPDMTYQELLDFHDKYYHPSNMLLMLYGDFSDVERFLEHLDSEYLSNYDRIEIQFDDPYYTPAEGYQELYYKFPATQSAETNHATSINYAFVLDNISITDYSLANIALATLGTDSSPVKQRMNQLFPNASFSVSLDNNSVQPTLHFLLYNAEIEDAPVFKETVDEMLPVIMGNNIDDSIMDLLINNARYNKVTTREGTNTGIAFFRGFTDPWAKTGRPDAYLEDVRILDELEGYKEDGTINTILSKILQNISASAMLVATPEPGLAEKNSADLAKKLADMKAAMSEEEIQALVDKCSDYNAWIENNAKISLIDQVKAVDAKSLPEEYDVASVTDETINDVRYITSEIPDCETFDMTIYLDAQGLPFENILDAVLATSLMGKIGTENYSREALQNEKYSKIKSLMNFIDTIFFNDGSGHQYLRIYGNGLCDQLDDTFRITEEIMLRTDFNDYDTIRQTAAETAMMTDMYTVYFPDVYMDAIGAALVNPAHFLNYYIGCSFEYKQYFENIAHMSDEEMAEVVERLQDVITFMLNRPGAIVTAIGSAETLERCLENANAFLGKIGNEVHTPLDYSTYCTLKGSTAFVFDTSVAYNYTFFNMTAAKEELTGQRMLVQSIVTDMILLPEVRFKNNAYGASNYIGEDIAYLKSYRDPNVSKTYEIYNAIPEKLRNMELTEEQLNGYITSVYSSIVVPRGPIAKATEAINDALENRDPERKLRYIREIKAVTLEDIHASADFYERINNEGTIATGIGEKIFAENSDMFETVLRMTAD